MITEIKELIHFRELLWIWTLRNIKVRYKQSFLGAAWAILQPLGLMLAFSIIFTSFVKVRYWSNSLSDLFVYSFVTLDSSGQFSKSWDRQPRSEHEPGH